MGESVVGLGPDVRRRLTLQDIGDDSDAPYVWCRGDIFIIGHFRGAEFRGGVLCPELPAGIVSAGESEVDDLDFVRGICRHENILRLEKIRQDHIQKMLWWQVDFCRFHWWKQGLLNFWNLGTTPHRRQTQRSSRDVGMMILAVWGYRDSADWKIMNICRNKSRIKGVFLTCMFKIVYTLSQACLLHTCQHLIRAVNFRKA